MKYPIKKKNKKRNNCSKWNDITAVEMWKRKSKKKCGWLIELGHKYITSMHIANIPPKI